MHTSESSPEKMGTETRKNGQRVRDSVYWTIFKVSNKLLRPVYCNSRTVYFLSVILGLLIIVNQTPSVDSICVWQGGGGFRLACGFRQSGLFRLRSLGGLKGWAGAGFTIGDEDGFKDSLTNTEQKPGGNQIQAQASQRQQQYQRVGRGQPQQKFQEQQQQQPQPLGQNGRNLAGQPQHFPEQQPQVQGGRDLVGQQTFQTGRQQNYPVFRPHAANHNMGGVQKRATLWESWKWPSILQKKRLGPPPPPRGMLRRPEMRREPPPGAYGRIPRPMHQPGPPMPPVPPGVPRQNHDQYNNQDPQQFQEYNNYPQVADLSPKRRGNPIPNFSPMPELQPLQADQEEEAQETQMRKKPYGLRLLENSSNYGKKYMVKPSIPGESSATTPDVSPNLGYDTNLFPDIYFTTTTGKKHLNKIMDLEDVVDTTEALLRKQKLKKIKRRKKGHSDKKDVMLEQTSPMTPETDEPSTTSKMTTVQTTNPSTAITSPSTSPSTTTITTSPATTKTTSTSPKITTTKKTTTSKKPPEPPTTKRRENTPKSDREWERPTTSNWRESSPPIIRENDEPLEDLTDSDYSNRRDSIRDPPRRAQWELEEPIREDIPSPPKRPSDNVPPKRQRPNRPNKKDPFPPWDYDDEIFYKLELPEKMDDKEREGSYSQRRENYNTRVVKPSQPDRWRAATSTTTEKDPYYNYHDFSDINPDSPVTSGRVKEFYDPRYPPDHEINQGRFQSRLPKPTTTTPEPPFYGGNNFFNPGNHFNKDSTLRTTVSVGGLGDEDGKFVKFDSRESLNMLSKTKAYNNQFYSHFNKSAGAVSIAAASSDLVNSYGQYPHHLNSPIRPPTTKMPLIEYPKPVDIEWAWENQKRLEQAYEELPIRPDKFIPELKMHGRDTDRDYFDPDIRTNIVSSTPSPDRWSGIGRGRGEDESSDELDNILKKKSLTINNWDPPSFWGPQMDRFVPATDFVTNDNFKIPKFGFDVKKFPATTLRTTTEDYEADFEHDPIFSSTIRYTDDDDWQRFKGIQKVLEDRDPFPEIPYKSVTPTSTAVPFVQTEPSDGLLLEESENIPIVRDSGELPGSSSVVNTGNGDDRRTMMYDIRNKNRKINGDVIHKNYGGDDKYHRESSGGFVDAPGQSALQTLEDEIKELTKEANSMFHGSSHKDDRNAGTGNIRVDRPEPERRPTEAPKEIQPSSNAPDENTRPPGGGIVKVTKLRKYKKKRPTTFLPISGPSTESILKVETNNVPPIRIQPPPPPSPQMFAYHIPQQSLGPPPTPPEPSEEHLHDPNIGSITHNDHMRTEWNLYPLPQMAQDLGLSRPDLQVKLEDKFRQNQPTRISHPNVQNSQATRTNNSPVKVSKMPVELEDPKPSQNASPLRTTIQIQGLGESGHQKDLPSPSPTIPKPSIPVDLLAQRPVNHRIPQEFLRPTSQSKHELELQGLNNASPSPANFPGKLNVSPSQIPGRLNNVSPSQLPGMLNVSPSQLPGRLNVSPSLHLERLNVSPSQLPERLNVSPSQNPMSSSTQSQLQQLGLSRFPPRRPTESQNVHNQLTSQGQSGNRNIAAQRLDVSHPRPTDAQMFTAAMENILRGSSASGLPNAPTMSYPSLMPGHFGSPTPARPIQPQILHAGSPTPNRPLNPLLGLPGSPTPARPINAQITHAGSPTPSRPLNPLLGLPAAPTPGRQINPQIIHAGSPTPARPMNQQQNLPGSPTPNRPVNFLPGLPEPSPAGRPLNQQMGFSGSPIPGQIGSPTPARPLNFLPGLPEPPSSGRPTNQQMGFSGSPTPSRPLNQQQNLPGSPTPNRPINFLPGLPEPPSSGRPQVSQNPSQQPQPPQPPRMLQAVRHMYPSPFPPSVSNRPPQNLPAPFPSPQFLSPLQNPFPSPNGQFLVNQNQSPNAPKPTEITKKPIPEVTKKPMSRKETLRLALETLSHARSDDIESVVNEQFGGELPGGIVKIVPSLPPHLTSTSTASTTQTTTSTTTTTTPKPTTTMPPTEKQPNIQIISLDEMASSLAPILSQLPNMNGDNRFPQSQSTQSENYQVVNLPLDEIALLASGGKESSSDNIEVMSENRLNSPQTFEAMLSEAFNNANNAKSQPHPTNSLPPPSPTTLTTKATTPSLAEMISQIGILQQQQQQRQNQQQQQQQLQQQQLQQQNQQQHLAKQLKPINSEQGFEAIKKLLMMNELDKKLGKVAPEFPNNGNSNFQILSLNDVLARLKAQPTQPAITTTTLKTLPFNFANPSIMTMVGHQVNQLNQQNKLNPLLNNFSRPTPPNLNNPTLLALKALALKRIQHVQPSPQISLPQQAAPDNSAAASEESQQSMDFVDLGPILSLGGSSRRSSEVEQERPKTRILQVRNAPKSYYPSDTDMNFDPVSTKPLFTDFRCEDQTYFPGLYADPSNSCKVFHLCAKTETGFLMKTFRCPKNSLFDNEVLRCNWDLYVECKGVQDKYHFNKYLSQSFQFLKTLGEFSSSYNSMNTTLAV